MGEVGSLENELKQLEEEWRRQGAPVADHMAPGLEDAQIDEVMAGLGVVLPGDLRVWWKWHDGLLGAPSDYDFGHGALLGKIGPGAWHPLSLQGAIARYRGMPRTPAWPADPIAGQFFWRDSWFPFASFGMNQDVLFVDTTAGPHPPVRVLWWTDWTDWDVEQAPTVAEAVAIWVRALREGYFVWDPGTGMWRDRVADLPAELRNGLTC